MSRGRLLWQWYRHLNVIHREESRLTVNAAFEPVLVDTA